MSRIEPVDYETANPEIKKAWDDLVTAGHPVSNMKAVILHSPVAVAAFLQWYELFAKVKPFLGKRLAVLFCHAISEENKCDLCYTYMRKEIIDSGEDPSQLELDDREKAVIAFGHQLAQDANKIPEPLFVTLRGYFTSVQLVELVTFGALMIVNNVFNSALQIPVDNILDPYTVHPEHAVHPEQIGN